MIYRPVILSHTHKDLDYQVVGFQPQDLTETICFNGGTEYPKDRLIIPSGFVKRQPHKTFPSKQIDLGFGDILFFGETPHMVIDNYSNDGCLVTLPLFCHYDSTGYKQHTFGQIWMVTKINRLVKV